MKVKLDDLVMGLETESDYLKSYVDKKTGKVIAVSQEVFDALDSGDDDMLSEMQEYQKEELDAARAVFDDPENARYLEAPERFDFDEYRQMEKFIRSLADEDAAGQLQQAIKGSGAFRYFKDTLHRLGIEKQWFAWRDAALKELVISWCEVNGIEYEDDLPQHG